MGWKNVNAVIENRLFLGKSVALQIFYPCLFDIDNLLSSNSILAARSSRSLTERRITHILSVCPDPIPAELPESGVCHMRISVEDVDYADLLIHLPSACQFIDQALRNGGNVLVHCVQGISRSATVIAAYCKNRSSSEVTSINRGFSNVVTSPRFNPSAGCCQSR